jgi:hypothetical protein
MHSLTSALDGGDWSASRPSRFIPRERAHGIQRIGGWAGPTAVLDAVVKRKIPNLRRESNPRIPILQPVAQRYTDRAITALGAYIIHGRNGKCIIHFGLKKLNGTHYLEDLSVDVRIILKLMLKISCDGCD